MLAIVFFQSPIYIAISLIGSNFPDFDHKIRKVNLYKLIAIGSFLTLFLYILNLPYLFGILIIILSLILYFSNHRGFTHSIIGIIILSILIFLIFLFGLKLLIPFLNQIVNYQQIGIAIIIIFLLAIFLNKKLLPIFLILFLGGIAIFPLTSLSPLAIFLSLFLGFLSHLILDSFTPKGIELFQPFSSKKVHNHFGIAILGILGVLAIVFAVNGVF